MSHASVLQLRDVTMRRGGRRVLSGVSFRVQPRQAIVVTGENGSGKSTLLAIAAGVLTGHAGQVILSGNCGYAPSTPDVPDHVTPCEWLALVASLRGTDAPVTAEIARMGLDEVAHRKVGTLSAGQRQRVSLAAAFLGSPALLVLDEPEGALDQAAVSSLMERLAGVSCLIATHDPTLAARLRASTLHLAAA